MLANGMTIKGMQYTARAITHFRVMATYSGDRGNKASGAGSQASGQKQQQQYKITMALDPLHPHEVVGLASSGVALAAQIREAMDTSTLTLGGQRLDGQAPRGQLERLLEARLRK